jgi:hypothetical protein
MFKVVHTNEGRDPLFSVSAVLIGLLAVALTYIIRSTRISIPTQEPTQEELSEFEKFKKEAGAGKDDSEEREDRNRK